MTATAPQSDRLTRGVLMLVMGAALTVGTWSIYTLLTARFGAPTPVAVFGSVMFDAAALFFARLAQRYATSPDSGLIPRLAMLGMVATSAWVNWTHAIMEGWGRIGGIILGGAPVVAELAFELHHRWEHREALRRQGRVPAALPVLGKWAWLLYLRTSFKVIRGTVGARLAAVEAREVRVRIDRPDTGQATVSAPAADRLQPVLPRPDKPRRTVLPAVMSAASGQSRDITADAQADKGADTPTSANTVRRTTADKSADRPDPSVSDLVRSALDKGIEDPAAILSAVRDRLGPDIKADTVHRTIRRQRNSYL